MNIEAADEKESNLKPENFKNPKLLPLIEEAWELLNKVKKREAELDKQISKIEKEKRKTEEMKT